MRLASIAENSFNAVERIDEFCELPQEAPAKIPGAKPDGWPTRGKVLRHAQPQKPLTPIYMAQADWRTLTRGCAVLCYS